MSRGRKPNAIPTIEWKLHIPVDLAAEIELILKDPIRQRAKYGARSELLEELLRDWLAKRRIEAITRAATDRTLDRPLEEQ